MTYKDFLAWARKRESLTEADDFWAYEEAYNHKASILIAGLKDYLEPHYEYVYYNAALHYVIVANFVDELGNTNPLYIKYKVADKNFITSSASDESSSASIHTTKSLNDGDITMTDLLRTPYGEYVYSILEQLNVGPILL